MKYTYSYSDHWRENPQILEQELHHLEQWLHNSGIDGEFQVDEHTYTTTDGDIWIFLPEVTQAQLMAATLILSSSELMLDNKPVRFDTPPNNSQEDNHID